MPQRSRKAASCTFILLLLLQLAAADVTTLSTAVLGSQPVWVQNRSADITLDFKKADPTFKYPRLGRAKVRGKDMEVGGHKGYYHGNVAVIRYGTDFILAVRKMHFYHMHRKTLKNYPTKKRLPGAKGGDDYIRWWGSKIAVCSADSRTLQPISCQDYDPRTWRECEWSQGFEGEGMEDPRLIAWPGKGLFMMFGSKPWPKHSSSTEPEDIACDGPWAFQPWLIQLKHYGSKPDPSDPWARGIIRLQYLSEEPVKKGELLKEKNWNPFIYKGKLYFSQRFDPHVVIRPSPNGTCERVFETQTKVFKHLSSQPRGNTQAVLVPSAFSGESRDFYLGIVHSEVNRTYQNYLYKMQARPPFRIYASSRPLPIINSQHPHVKQWTSVSFPMSLQLMQKTSQVMIGYGSGDQVPHVKFMTWNEVEAHFPDVPGMEDANPDGDHVVFKSRAAKRRHLEE